MRKIFFTWALFCLSAATAMAQSNNNEDNVIKIDEANQRAYRSGQALVKFKDESPVSVKKRASGRMKVSSSALQSVINQLGVTDMEQLMPVGGKRRCEHPHVCVVPMVNHWRIVTCQGCIW